MTGLTPNSIALTGGAAGRYRVPGVYALPRPRAAELPPTRTDVAGFVGFEPRFRPAARLTRAAGVTTGPFTGHEFALDLPQVSFTVEGRRARMPGPRRVILSKSAAGTLLAADTAVRFTLAAAERAGLTVLASAAGAVAGPPPGDPRRPAEFAQPPSAAALQAAVRAALVAAGDVATAADTRPWVRLADVVVERFVVADGLGVTVVPAPDLPPARCDDWQDFVAQLGPVPVDGTVLARAVRAFFTNGGSRCYVATVRRPDFTDATGVLRARQDMLGVRGAAEEEATGLERLLLVEEVAVVDVPDLHARRAADPPPPVQLPPPEKDACFRPCPDRPRPAVLSQLEHQAPGGIALFDENGAIELQRQLILRCAPEKWRVLLLLSPPLVLEDGLHVPPSSTRAQAWRDRVADPVGMPDTYEMSCAALYYPWVLVQESVGDEPYELPPAGPAAGVIARRDLARGPHVSPAGESLDAVVALVPPIDDEVNGRLYLPDADAAGNPVPALNVLRAFAGYGVQVWGARTLSTDRWLRYLAVRRCLSAIERRCKAALDALAFEPHTPLLWVQATHLVVGVLLPLFEAGGLRGQRPNDAFYIRCDGSVNPPESIADGKLVCEVGVAIAAPAEFVVFRLGRREGVVDVVE